MKGLEKCPICDSNLERSEGKQISYPAQDNDKDICFENIELCGRCGSGSAFPVISEDEIMGLYENGAYWKRIDPESAFRTGIVPNILAVERWKRVENILVKTGTDSVKVLDIGAGYGFFGAACANSKTICLKKYTCVEADPQMTQYLQDYWSARDCEYGFSVKKALDDVSGEYDVIVLSHILEHLRNPMIMLKQAVKLLSEKGILVIDVPNQDHVFKKNVFPHILFFNAEGLGQLIKREPDLDVLSLVVYGRDMKGSPMHKKAPIVLKCMYRLVRLVCGIMPYGALVRFYKWYYGIDCNNENGTWIRAICRKK